ncbi:hypothetical protein DVH24_030257 [Malus domestica]|uniref:Uncharacterized protein n=1 Tax=Malus domestica TaxID=3750 RepID=A0A498J590_MALDO|nr:hypothetical protein DVH24_035562 [Malus domestica]RXI09758.1 hypothetical protein DVH24_030257 [Malus domestica]
MLADMKGNGSRLDFKNGFQENWPEIVNWIIVEFLKSEAEETLLFGAALLSRLLIECSDSNRGEIGSINDEILKLLCTTMAVGLSSMQ